jgi:hypothetical protein
MDQAWRGRQEIHGNADRTSIDLALAHHDDGCCHRGIEHDREKATLHAGRQVESCERRSRARVTQLRVRAIEIGKAADTCPAASALNVVRWAPGLEIDANSDVTAL